MRYHTGTSDLPTVDELKPLGWHKYDARIARASAPKPSHAAPSRKQKSRRNKQKG